MISSRVAAPPVAIGAGLVIVLDMGLDLHIAPGTGFLDWTANQWDEFLNTDPAPESIRLGPSIYVASVIEAVFHNLEGDEPGSRFPLFARIDTSDTVGWYANEITPLVAELNAIKAALTLLPVSQASLGYDSEEEFQRRVSDFKTRNPQRPSRNLYDLHFHFFDSFADLAKKAAVSGQGLFVSY